MVLPPLLRPREYERSFVMLIIERKFDGNPLTSGRYSVAPITDDVSDSIFKGKGGIQPESDWKPTNSLRCSKEKLEALQELAAK
jgi:hypothetical protein